MSFSLSPDGRQQLNEVLSRYPTPRAAMLPTLWLCQKQHGWISPAIVDFVAEKLQVSTAVVRGVVSFYTMFFDEPVGENVVWVCRTLACELRGAAEIQRRVEAATGCTEGDTSRDGKFTVLKAECLGACGQAPMVQINDRFFEGLTLAKVDELIEVYKTGGRAEAETRFATTAVFDSNHAGPAPAVLQPSHEGALGG